MSRDERGVAVASGLVLMGVLVVVAILAAAIGGLVAAHRQAEAAADLAALAGAAGVQDGRDPCARAAGVARANRARVVGCRVDGFEVTVTVVVTGARFLGQRPDLRARARAGPVDGAGSGLQPVG